MSGPYVAQERADIEEGNRPLWVLQREAGEIGRRQPPRGRAAVRVQPVHERDECRRSDQWHHLRHGDPPFFSHDGT
jgi:hypothetical protein